MTRRQLLLSLKNTFKSSNEGPRLTADSIRMQTTGTGPRGCSTWPHCTGAVQALAKGTGPPALRPEVDRRGLHESNPWVEATLHLRPSTVGRRECTLAGDSACGGEQVLPRQVGPICERPRDGNTGGRCWCGKMGTRGAWGMFWAGGRESRGEHWTEAVSQQVSLQVRGAAGDRIRGPCPVQASCSLGQPPG